jgi:hypothetical protein
MDDFVELDAETEKQLKLLLVANRLRRGIIGRRHFLRAALRVTDELSLGLKLDNKKDLFRLARLFRGRSEIYLQLSSKDGAERLWTRSIQYALTKLKPGE